jgi:Caspase domain
MAANRGAVVIGVNKTGELTPLESAAAAAEDVARWLQGEGFKVVKLTDAEKPVTAAAIRRAVTKFVDAGTYEQLVVYFSGHGYWKNETELWLLSGAPGDSNEAVNWTEAVDLAQVSGIPNVVMISDACRSMPTTTTGGRVRGSAVFPNNPTNAIQPKIDKLLASVVGTAAYEVALPNGPAGKVSVFTHCLRKAFTEPDATMVLTLQEGRKTLEVVPLRRLEKFLRREVPALLSSVSLEYDQRPVIDVLSDEPAYLARVQRLPGAVVDETAPTTPRQPVTVDEVARAAVAAEISPDGAGGFQRYLRGPAAEAGRELRAMRSEIETPPPVTRFESQTGFTVLGAEVQGRVAGGGGHVDDAGEEHPNVAAVRIWLGDGKSSCSVAITFADGTGTVLPALKGYLGHITVADDGGVANVSYVPSEHSVRWDEYVTRREQIDSLRSAVAAAASLGVLRLREDEGEKFADRMRVGKQFDPTLGLYAAYAYAAAGPSDHIHSIREYMYYDLNVSLFDVAMLDRGGQLDELGGHVPFCPLLSQGWNYLRARGITLPSVLDDAQDELVQSLWTTFKPEAMRLISNALEQGELG